MLTTFRSPCNLHTWRFRPLLGHSRLQRRPLYLLEDYRGGLTSCLDLGPCSGSTLRQPSVSNWEVKGVLISLMVSLTEHSNNLTVLTCYTRLELTAIRWQVPHLPSVSCLRAHQFRHFTPSFDISHQQLESIFLISMVTWLYETASYTSAYHPF